MQSLQERDVYKRQDQLHDAVKYIHGTYQEAELPELGEGEAIDTSIPADPNVKNYSGLLYTSRCV